METTKETTVAKNKRKSGVVIIKCTCENEFQDSMYGKGNRIANICRGGDYGRCTVCVKEKAI